MEFHKNNYHPSKAFFYLYGISFDLMVIGNESNVLKNFGILNDYLNDYAILPVLNSIKPSSKIDLFHVPKKRRIFIHGPKDPMADSLENQYRASLTFYTCHNTVRFHQSQVRI